MSRNLCTSQCCENVVRLEDIRGKPIEFRQCGGNPPVIGTRWDCPTCKTAYFAWWRNAKWIEREQRYTNFVIDLSYYESFNDEHDTDASGNICGLDDPACVCKDNAEEYQDVW